MSRGPQPGTSSLSGAHGAVARVAPGLGVVALGVVAAVLLSRSLPGLSPLTVAVVTGVLVGNLPLPLDRFRPGLALASRTLLRAGVVLLGFRLPLGDVLLLGARGLAVVVVAVLVTFVGTQWLGRRLGLSPELSLLVATGFSICGASAVAAMNGVVRARKEDVTTAVALVTVFGTLAMVLLPLLQAPLHLSDAAYGTWVGASVHDVGQTVAAASAAGPAALAAAVVVKLTRVLLLAPMIAGASLWQRRSLPAAAGRTRPPVVPLFVLGFLAAVGVRSTGLLPEGVVSGATAASTLLLTAALFALGTSVQVRALAVTGPRALVLGAVSWVTICVLAYTGVSVVAA